MVRLDLPNPAAPALDVGATSGKELSVDQVVLRLPSGETIGRAPDVKLAPGQRLLVDGPSGAGKSCLVRAIAGLWPLGDGRIRIPQGAHVLALPQRPYFPLGTLKQALTYPMLAAAVDDADVRAAMIAAGLEHLLDRLHEEGDWSTVLSGGEQQRAGFARAFINRPTILLLDEPVSALEDAEARDLYRNLVENLPEAVVLSIGGGAALADVSHRTVEMSAPSVDGRTRPAVLAAATA
jgi:putative ATP-binding cassette transporter